SAGNLLQRSFSDGEIAHYSYDASGFRTQAGDTSFAYDNRQGIAETNGITFGRDEERRMASVTLAPGRTVTYAYNTRGLLSSVSEWAGGVTTVESDAARRLVRIN